MHRTLALLAVAALSLSGWTALRKRHRQRLAARPHAKPEALQHWEGEGGSLPDGGPGMKVSPVVAMDAEDAAGEADSRSSGVAGTAAGGRRR